MADDEEYEDRELAVSEFAQCVNLHVRNMSSFSIHFPAGVLFPPFYRRFA